MKNKTNNNHHLTRSIATTLTLTLNLICNEFQTTQHEKVGRNEAAAAAKGNVNNENIKPEGLIPASQI